MALTGCELMVQLDRSAVDAGEAGCNLCSDASFADGAQDARPDAVARDADARAAATGDSSAGRH